MSKERHMAEKSPSKAKKIILISLIVFFVIVIGLGIFVKVRYDFYTQQVNQMLPEGTICSGVTVQGVDISGKTIKEAKKLLKAEENKLKDNIDIKINLYNGNSTRLKTENVSFSFDTKDILKQAYTLGRTGNIKEQYEELVDVAENKRTYSITKTIPKDNKLVKKFIAETKKASHVDVQSPYVSTFTPYSSNRFTYVDGINGADLKDSDLLADIMDKIIGGKFTDEVTASFHITKFKGSIKALKKQTVLLSTFSTTSTNNANGNHNMALALSSINGTRVKSGESFSFNTTTGDTTLASNGYLSAGAILEGGVVGTSVGGGICQAATTLYGAVMRADLDVTNRTNHVYASTYVPVGQDATVDYPGVDFCFTNNSGYEVFIEAGMSGTTLTCSIYGYQPKEWDTIEVTSQTTNRTSAGYSAAGNKIFYKNGKVVKQEAIASSYYEVDKD